MRMSYEMPVKRMLLVTALLIAQPAHASPEMFFDDGHWRVWRDWLANGQQACFARLDNQYSDTFIGITILDTIDDQYISWKDSNRAFEQSNSVSLKVDTNAPWRLAMNRDGNSSRVTGRFGRNIAGFFEEIRDGKYVVVTTKSGGEAFELFDSRNAMRRLDDCGKMITDDLSERYRLPRQFGTPSK